MRPKSLNTPVRKGEKKTIQPILAISAWKDWSGGKLKASFPKQQIENGSLTTMTGVRFDFSLLGI